MAADLSDAVAMRPPWPWEWTFSVSRTGSYVALRLTSPMSILAMAVGSYSGCLDPSHAVIHGLCLSTTMQQSTQGRRVPVG